MKIKAILGALGIAGLLFTALPADARAPYPRHPVMHYHHHPVPVHHHHHRHYR